MIEALDAIVAGAYAWRRATVTQPLPRNACTPAAVTPARRPRASDDGGGASTGTGEVSPLTHGGSEYLSGMSARDAQGSDEPTGPDPHSVTEQLPLPEVVARLREWLGAQLTAYIASVTSTRTIAEWAGGAGQPDAEIADRIRLAYDVASVVLGHNDKGLAQAWFQGQNSGLGDTSPARAIRERQPDAVRHDVMSAAASFAYVG